MSIASSTARSHRGRVLAASTRLRARSATISGNAPSIARAGASGALLGAVPLPGQRVVKIQLDAREADWEFTPGRPTRAWTYNGQVPGPLIQATVGDVLEVRLTNNLSEPTILHWHGVRLPAAMDGTEMVQAAVQPGQTFTYPRSAILIPTNLANRRGFLINDELHHRAPDVIVGELQVWDLVNLSEVDHPFHLHGFFFQVVDRDGQPPGFQSWEDTVNVPVNGRVRIAWIADDRPGEWMYHCHILEHHAAGMMAHSVVRHRGARPEPVIERRIAGHCPTA